MKYTLLAILLFVFGSQATAQNNIAQFAVWQPKEGAKFQFEEGYKRHLDWHKQHGDKWDWYGWYIISGPRYGFFVDATIDRAWTDFDHAVDPSADMADNNLHVFPFGNLRALFKVEIVRPASARELQAFKARLVRMITLDTDDPSKALRVVQRFKEKCLESACAEGLITTSIKDGGDSNQIILFIGHASWKDYEKTANIAEELMKIQENQKTTSIRSVTLETLSYRPDMSLFN